MLHSKIKVSHKTRNDVLNNFKGQKGKTSRVDRERKKKVLQERRKPLNVDHLAHEKLLEKLAEMHTYLCTIEKEK